MSEGKKEILLGDCLELYKDIEPKSIDLICTDLPYGTTACKWDTIIPFDKLWEMVNYLLKPNGAFITTASQPFTSALVMSNPKMFRYELIWNKKKGANPLLSNRMPMKSHENVLVFYNSLPTYNPQFTNGDAYNAPKTGGTKTNNYIKSNEKVTFKQKSNNGFRHPLSIMDYTIHCGTKIHPTEKPVELMQYLLKTYSNEGMTIFDPCMGSGTTGVACKNLNRNFIGIEKDEGYFKIAEQRINVRTLFS